MKALRNLSILALSFYLILFSYTTYANRTETVLSIPGHRYGPAPLPNIRSNVYTGDEDSCPDGIGIDGQMSNADWNGSQAINPINITNPQDDHVGYTINTSWNEARTYKALHCNCNGSYIAHSTHFWGYYPSGMTENINGVTYYIINDYIEVAISVYLQSMFSHKWVSLPFQNFDNNHPQYCSGDARVFNSGSQGKVTVRLRKPFIGHMIINNEVANIYAVWNSNETPALSHPLIKLVLNGEIYVPATCTFESDNSTLTFPAITMNNLENTSDLEQIKTMSPQTMRIRYSCTNMKPIDPSLKLYFSILGNTSRGGYLQSSNAAIAFLIMRDGHMVTTYENSNQFIPKDINQIDRGATTENKKTFTLTFTPVRNSEGKATTGSYVALGTIHAIIN